MIFSENRSPFFRIMRSRAAPRPRSVRPPPARRSARAGLNCRKIRIPGNYLGHGVISIAAGFQPAMPSSVSAAMASVDDFTAGAEKIRAGHGAVALARASASRLSRSWHTAVDARL
jgi:hypothetical protein